MMHAGHKMRLCLLMAVMIVAIIIWKATALVGESER